MSWDPYSLIENDFVPPPLPRAQVAARAAIAHTLGRWPATDSRERQILTRLARAAPVFVVEPPVFADDVAIGRLDLSMPAPGVWRAVPRLPSELIHDEDETLDRVRHFSQQMVGPSAPLAPHFPEPVQWFFTPMPAPRMLGAFGEAGVVYDCVDERTWLRLAPRGAGERERMLLAHADVVFASYATALRIRARGHRRVHVVRVAKMEEIVRETLATRVGGRPRRFGAGPAVPERRAISGTAPFVLGVNRPGAR